MGIRVAGAAAFSMLGCLLWLQTARAVQVLAEEEPGENPLNNGLETPFFILTNKEKEGFQLKVKQRQEYEVTQQEKINKWHVAEKEKVSKYEEMKEKHFLEMMRKLHCGKLKKKLNRAIVVTGERANKIAKERKIKYETNEAMTRANEVMGKVNGKGEEQQLRTGLLGDSKVQLANGVNPKDAKYWLKAFKVADPSWIANEHQRLRRVERTDPNWRAKMDNSEGDGGYSWTQKVTRMGTSFDRNSQQQLTEVNPGVDVGGSLALVEVGESELPPGEKPEGPVGGRPEDTSPGGSVSPESDEAAPLPPGEGHVNREPTEEPEQVPNQDDPQDTVPKPGDNQEKNKFELDEDDTAVLRRQAEQAKWLAEKSEKLNQVRNQEHMKLGGWVKTQQKHIKDLEVRRDHIAYCTQERNDMGLKISNLVFSLPCSDAEKSAYEIPLSKSMKEWLDCEFCNIGDKRVPPSFPDGE